MFMSPPIVDQTCTFQCIIPTGDLLKYDRRGRESPSVLLHTHQDSGGNHGNILFVSLYFSNFFFFIFFFFILRLVF